jgi:hypothetical protein
MQALDGQISILIVEPTACPIRRLVLPEATSLSSARSEVCLPLAGMLISYPGGVLHAVWLLQVREATNSTCMYVGR